LLIELGEEAAKSSLTGCFPPLADFSPPLLLLLLLDDDDDDDVDDEVDDESDEDEEDATEDSSFSSPLAFAAFSRLKPACSLVMLVSFFSEAKREVVFTLGVSFAFEAAAAVSPPIIILDETDAATTLVLVKLLVVSVRWDEVSLALWLSLLLRLPC